VITISDGAMQAQSTVEVVRFSDAWMRSEGAPRCHNAV
jgi:hypothetical protein